MEDPSEKLSMHRHFARYSKGNFSGPSFKLTITPSKIAVNSTFEYEDLLEFLAAQYFPEDDVSIQGSIVTGKDINDELSKIGVATRVEESSGKTKAYKAKVQETVSKDQLMNLIESVSDSGYILLSFKEAGKGGISLTTKKNPPRPNPKNPEQGAAESALQFCKANFPNSADVRDALIDQLLPDFKEELPPKFKKIQLDNEYNFNELIIPQGLPSSQIRLKTIRVGKLRRKLDVDGESFEKQYKVRA